MKMANEMKNRNSFSIYRNVLVVGENGRGIRIGMPFASMNERNGMVFELNCPIENWLYNKETNKATATVTNYPDILWLRQMATNILANREFAMIKYGGGKRESYSTGIEARIIDVKGGIIDTKRGKEYAVTIEGSAGPGQTNNEGGIKMLPASEQNKITKASIRLRKEEAERMAHAIMLASQAIADLAYTDYVNKIEELQAEQAELAAEFHD
jgi:uncharacterized protein (UPF0335 family)